jgi:aquaporin Z
MTSKPARSAPLGIALAFGLSLLVMACVIGPVSGCHINPAATLGAALARVIEVALVPFSVIGQVLGAAFGALVVFVIANGDNAFSSSGTSRPTAGATASPAATPTASSPSRWSRSC